jgi:hypothetical protein
MYVCMYVCIKNVWSHTSPLYFASGLASIYDIQKFPAFIPLIYFCILLTLRQSLAADLLLAFENQARKNRVWRCAGGEGESDVFWCGAKEMKNSSSWCCRLPELTTESAPPPHRDLSATRVFRFRFHSLSAKAVATSRHRILLTHVKSNPCVLITATGITNEIFTKRNVRSSGMLRRVAWYLVSDVPVPPMCPIF